MIYSYTEAFTNLLIAVAFKFHLGAVKLASSTLKNIPAKGDRENLEKMPKYARICLINLTLKHSITAMQLKLHRKCLHALV